MTIAGFDNDVHNHNLFLNLPINEASGSRVHDTSKYHANGDITGSAWLYLPAENKWCLDFDPAIPSYVEIPAAHNQLDFTSEDFSAIIRMNVDNLVSDQIIFNRGMFQTDGWDFFVNTLGVIWFRTFQLGTFQQSGTGGVIAGGWFTYGFSRYGSVCDRYFNGVKEASASGVHVDPVTSLRSALIGIYTDKVSNPLDSKVEFLGIFGGVALSDQEHYWWHRHLVGV